MEIELLKSTTAIVTVLLTAALSGYLIPKITQRWQDHQKELEIKTSLVEEINQAVLQILLAIQFAVRHASSQEEFDSAYRSWEVNRAVLTGKLRVYFEAKIAEEFEELAEAISDFYALTGILSADLRAEQITKLRNYFGNSATNWSDLENLNLATTSFLRWFEAWWKIRQTALLRKDVVIGGLLNSHVLFLH